jgi:N-acetylneuraminic acid mutarotase
VNINYQQFYDDFHVRKWERVISEENVDDEECKES